MWLNTGMFSKTMAGTDLTMRVVRCSRHSQGCPGVLYPSGLQHGLLSCGSTHLFVDIRELYSALTMHVSGMSMFKLSQVASQMAPSAILAPSSSEEFADGAGTSFAGSEIASPQTSSSSASVATTGLGFGANLAPLATADAGNPPVTSVAPVAPGAAAYGRRATALDASPDQSVSREKTIEEMLLEASVPVTRHDHMRILSGAAAHLAGPGPYDFQCPHPECQGDNLSTICLDAKMSGSADELVNLRMDEDVEVITSDLSKPLRCFVLVDEQGRQQSAALKEALALPPAQRSVQLAARVAQLNTLSRPADGEATDLTADVKILLPIAQAMSAGCAPNPSPTTADQERISNVQALLESMSKRSAAASVFNNPYKCAPLLDDLLSGVPFNVDRGTDLDRLLPLFRRAAIDRTGRLIPAFRPLAARYLALAQETIVRARLRGSHIPEGAEEEVGRTREQGKHLALLPRSLLDFDALLNASSLF